MLYLPLLLLFILTAVVWADGETKCRDPADCPMYPLHSCFATTSGMVCKNTREYSGFEVSMNLIETFNYRPTILPETDTGAPCQTIPLSTDLTSYVESRGPDVLEISDLDLMGNCSQQSYCHPLTRTCERKHGMGSACQHHMECAVGKEYLPGHCNHHNSTRICGLRQDIPSFYYGAALRGDWKVGAHWKEAIAAVIITGSFALCVLLGRTMLKTWLSTVASILSPKSRPDSPDDDNNPHRPWWHFLPKRNSRDMQSTYLPLDTRPAHPPPYQGS